MKIGSVLQKIGEEWGNDEGQYVVIDRIVKECFYYRCEKNAYHYRSGPWTLDDIKKYFIIIEEL